MAAYQGLYIDGLSDILGEEQAESELLDFVKSHNFTTLSLYEIQKILHKGDISKETTDELASFISRARNEFGINHIAGIAENADFFTNVISKYNSVRGEAAEKMDVYNVEFEFWNDGPIYDFYCDYYLKPSGLPCDTSGAYTFFKTQFKDIHQLSVQDKCICETYVGWPAAQQAKEMLANANRILVHAYVTDPVEAFEYVKERLSYYGIAGKANIIIIFSAEPEFLGPWLNSNKPEEAYTIFLKNYNEDHSAWKKNIKLLGYQWYVYSELAQALAI